MNIGIFGGSFDPIHNAHLTIAELALQRLDRIIFVPCGNPPHKKLNASAAQRLHMVEMAIEGLENMCCSDFEIKAEQMSYSVHTIEHFKRIYRNIFFIIGDDAYAEIHLWKEYEKVRTLCQFMVFRRKGLTVDDSVIRINNPIINVSSTDIRQMIMSGKGAEDYLPPRICEYIRENRIYQT